MDVEELEVRLVIDNNLVARIETNTVPPSVLPSLETPKHEQPLTMSSNRRIKCKLHSMTLRSESREQFKDDALSSSSPLSSPSSSIVAAGLPITREPSLAANPIVHETEEPQLSRVTYPARCMNHTTPAPVRFPSTPVSTRNRVWETRHPPSQDFHIWEGPNTGHTTSPIQQDQYSSFSPQDEDKENIFSIRSDLSSSGDEAQQSLTLNQGATNPRDAFGIPLAHQISDFVEGSNTSPTANLPVRPERQVLRPIWVPVPEDPEEPAEQ